MSKQGQSTCTYNQPPFQHFHQLDFLGPTEQAGLVKMGCKYSVLTRISSLGHLDLENCGVKSTVSKVFEGLKFKISEGYKQN